MLAFTKRGDDPLSFRVHAGGGVDDEQDQVSVLRARPRRRDHRAVEAALRLKDAWRVDQQDLRVAFYRDPHQPRAGGLLLWADDRDLLANERIHQRRFACVRRADDGDETCVAHCNCDNNAVAAAVSASCLLDPSAVASPSLATETRMVNFGAW